MGKTVDLVSPVESFYARYPTLTRKSLTFREFEAELRHYPERTTRVFARALYHAVDQPNQHTYVLRRRYVRGTHKFGDGSILSEPRAHRKWRQKHAQKEKERREAKKARLQEAESSS